MKISLVDKDNNPINLDNNQVKEGQNIVKAYELSERQNLLFIQDSRSGQVVCKPNLKTIQLNESLHQND